MKNLIVKSTYVAMLIAVFMMGACSQNEMDEQEIVNQHSEQAQMEELIRYIQEIKPIVYRPMDAETRGFWKNFGKWFKRLGTSDSGGYRWAEENGLNLGNRLMISLTTSLVAAINGDNARVAWKVNGEWKMYPNSNTLPNYKKIGNQHNQGIYELCKEYPNLKYGANISTSTLLTMAEKKTKAMGYSTTSLSSLQRGNIIIMLDNLKNALNNSSDLTNVFCKNYASRVNYDFLDEYLDAVLLLDNKEEMIAFTERIYTKIDSLSAVNKLSLKNMVSIALCSVNLWIPIQ